MENKLELLIITGMSGAGKTVAVHSLEDLGYFVVDNLPPKLLTKFWEIMIDSDNINKVAVVIDLRSKNFYDELISEISSLEDSQKITVKILFLDASDDELVTRYKETRRNHPLSVNGRLLDGIQRERILLEPVKNQSQMVIDTTELSPRQLREQIIEVLKGHDSDLFHIEVMSFGFKYGLPIDADLVMDVRFLPNPFYVPELRLQTGLDKPVYDYVMDRPETKKFYQDWLNLLQEIIPGYVKEGKSNLTIAIGCTGGQHRSVAIADKLARDLGKRYTVSSVHRDAAISQEILKTNADK